MRYAAVPTYSGNGYDFVGADSITTHARATGNGNTPSPKLTINLQAADFGTTTLHFKHMYASQFAHPFSLSTTDPAAAGGVTQIADPNQVVVMDSAGAQVDGAFSVAGNQ